MIFSSDYRVILESNAVILSDSKHSTKIVLSCDPSRVSERISPFNRCAEFVFKTSPTFLFGLMASSATVNDTDDNPWQFDHARKFSDYFTSQLDVFCGRGQLMSYSLLF